LNKEKQDPPKGDNRYRVHRSVKCYIASLECGLAFCTWNFSDSIERVVYLSSSDNKCREFVLYKNNYYELQTPERMKEIVRNHLLDGGGVNLPGKSIWSTNDEFESYPFIDVTSSDDRERYPRLRELWLNPDYIFNDNKLEYEYRTTRK